MNAFRSGSPEDRVRRSHRVALVLLGAAGVIGLGTIVDSWRQAAAGDPVGPTGTGEAPITPVSTEQVYSNNDYVPGVGYYHAAAHAWFPYPYNYHDPARGYFAGGLWQALPWAIALSQSRPNLQAVTAAQAVQRQEQEERARRASTSGFTGGSGGSSFSSRPSGGSAPSHPSSHPSIIRGGFGSFGHGGSS